MEWILGAVAVLAGPIGWLIRSAYERDERDRQGVSEARWVAYMGVIDPYIRILTGTLRWSYFVGQSEGKVKVDSDWL